jgi:hypothetical protein
MIEGLRLRFTRDELFNFMDESVDKLQLAIAKYPTHERKHQYELAIVKLTIIKSHLFDDEYSLTIADLEELGIIV